MAWEATMAWEAVVVEAVTCCCLPQAKVRQPGLREGDAPAKGGLQQASPPEPLHRQAGTCLCVCVWTGHRWWFLHTWWTLHLWWSLHPWYSSHHQYSLHPWYSHYPAVPFTPGPPSTSRTPDTLLDPPPARTSQPWYSIHSWYLMTPSHGTPFIPGTSSITDNPLDDY